MPPTTGREIDINDFTYSLPDERIARHPLPRRDAAKLLLHHPNGEREDHHFYDLPDLLPPGTFLIGNATRVIHARLYFTIPNGRTVEIFCLEPLEPADYQRSFSSTTSVVWKCLVGGNRRWKSGRDAYLELELDGEKITLTAERLERLDGAFAIRLSWPGGVAFGPLLDAAGSIPLPPYLGRGAEAEDHERYQTVFAQAEGSVAAPTAGLHLSEELFARLRQQNLNWGEVILHVGAGTFKPVASPTLAGHEMHQEYFEVDRQFLERLAAQLEIGQAIVGVGTTTTRCLESLYYLGSRLRREGESLVLPISIDQWEAQDHHHHISPLLAIREILDRMRGQRLYTLEGNTRLIITPEVGLRMVDGLITNFHQPNSTLLLIVAATVGTEGWRPLYDHALANDYRFLSYGDGSLLWKRSSET